MPLVKDPPDFARPMAPPELRARLAEAIATTAAVAPLVDRAVAIWREASAQMADFPSDDAGFFAAEAHFTETSGSGVLEAALTDLWNTIAAALIGAA